MGRTLPFNVAVFNAVIASFNSYDDAREYSISQSIKYPVGWVEMRDANNFGVIIVAYENAKVVYGKN